MVPTLPRGSNAGVGQSLSNKRARGKEGLRNNATKPLILILKNLVLNILKINIIFRIRILRSWFFISIERCKYILFVEVCYYLMVTLSFSYLRLALLTAGNIQILLVENEYILFIVVSGALYFRF